MQSGAPDRQGALPCFTRLLERGLAPRKVFVELQARFPSDKVLQLNYATWLSEMERTEDAEHVFTQLISSADKRRPWPHLHLRIGQHLLRLGKWAAAAKQFGIVLEIHRGFQMAHDGMAKALRGLAKDATASGDLAKAKKYVTQAERHLKLAIKWALIRQAPVARFHAALGWFYLDERKYPKALAAFNSGIAEDADHFGSNYGKGKLLTITGDYGEALPFLEKAVEVGPQPLVPPASEELPSLIAQCKLEPGKARAAAMSQ